ADRRGVAVAKALELVAVGIERMARNVEAQGGLLALELLVPTPRLGDFGERELAAEVERRLPVAASCRGIAAHQHAEQVRLTTLAIGTGFLADVDRVVDRR